jgi:hypothetical protein
MSAKAVLLTSINNIVASTFTQITQTCAAEISSEQIINVSCNPTLSGDVNDPNSEPYENHDACKLCIGNVKLNALAAYEQQRAVWDNGGVPAVRKPIDQDFQNVLSEMTLCGTRCKACVFQDLSQQTVITGVTECRALNTIENQITQLLSANVDQTLTNNQDFLSPLTQLFGAKSRQDVVFTITNRIKPLISIEVKDAIINQISNSQIITLTSSTNATVRGTTQQSAFNSITTYLAATKIFNQVFSEAELESFQTLVNTQNTVDSLGNAVVAGTTAFARMIKGVLGKIIIAVFVVVGFVFASIVAYLAFTKIKKLISKQKIHS